MITPRAGSIGRSGIAIRAAKPGAWAAVLGFVAALFCLALPATAVDRYWADGSGQWDVSDNWNPSGQPQVGDDVYLTQSDAVDRTVAYYNTTNPTAVLNSLTIDSTGAGTMTLGLSSGHAISVNMEHVGYDGRGAVTQGSGTHSTEALYLGYRTGSGGTVTVAGQSSAWVNATNLYVGYDGTGTLKIEAGGQVSSGWDGYLGHGAGSTGTVTVTGAGSARADTMLIHVGREGIGTLNIEAGGQVSNGSAYLGEEAGSRGTVTVTGAGSTWSNSGLLYVGLDGAGTLTVTDGGLVSAHTLYASPGDLCGDGTISARGAVLDADLVFDSTHGLTQMLPFGAGGTLDLNVDGTGTLGAGHKGTGTLRIADGRAVVSSSGDVGCQAGANGTATVAGLGSTWTTRQLSVGYSGTGTMSIEAGGQVSNSDGFVGYGLHSTGTITVTGAGSRWTNSGYLRVGCFGAGTMSIVAGGQVGNAYGCIGSQVGSSGTAMVDGTGSIWDSTGWLSIGGWISAAGGTGCLTVQNGGRVTVGGDLKIWPTGTLTIQSDGSVTASSITRLTGGTILWTDGTLSITGTAGLAINSAGPLGASVTLDAGKMLNVTNTTTVLAGAALTLAGGTLATGRLSKAGSFTWTDGTLSITGTAGLAISSAGPLGASVTLDAGKTLSVTTTTNVTSNGGALTLAGGCLTTGKLVTTGSFTWIDGTLGITGTDGLAISSAGPLGASVTLDAGKTLNVTNTVTIAPEGILTVDGGGFSANTLTNSGIIKLMIDDTAAFASAITNSATTEFEVGTGTWTYDETLGGSGTFIKSGAGTLVIAGLQDYDPGAVFNISGGTMVLATDAGSQGADLSVSVTDAELRFASNQHLDTLNIGDGGEVVFAGANMVVLKHLVMGGIDFGAATLTPEPATLALLALGGALALLRRRSVSL